MKLSIGILVSNRIETIRKCMDSLVSLLKTIPSELIALDTVGENTDGSIEIVKEYTDKVYRYEWCKDFADARNTCLQYASGEWFLFLDDDEWFDNVEDLISFFQTTECELYQFGTFLIRNYTVKGTYSTTVTTRLIRRREDTRFEGKIHEMFHEIMPPGKQFESFLHHSGYAFADDESKRVHQERNIAILEQELKEKELSPRLCAQMVQELMFRNETAQKGYEYCMNCLPELEKQGWIMDSCTQWMLVATVRYFHKLHGYEATMQQAKVIKTNYTLSETAELALCGILVNAAVKAYDVAIIPELVETYLKNLKWLQRNPEAARAQNQLNFPKYQEIKYVIQMLQAGATAANGLKQYEKAYEFWCHLPWKTDGFDGSKYQQALLETLRGLADKEPLLKYYQHFYKEECFLPENWSCLPEECREALRVSER